MIVSNTVHRDRTMPRASVHNFTAWQVDRATSGLKSKDCNSSLGARMFLLPSGASCPAPSCNAFARLRFQCNDRSKYHPNMNRWTLRCLFVPCNSCLWTTNSSYGETTLALAGNNSSSVTAIRPNPAQSPCPVTNQPFRSIGSTRPEFGKPP